MGTPLDLFEISIAIQVRGDDFVCTRSPSKPGVLEKAGLSSRNHSEYPGGGFRAHRGAASLKLRRCDLVDLPDRGFPRPSWRGLIEAESDSPTKADILGFPRPSWRGLIEAVGMHRTCDGPKRFRAHRGAASLKLGRRRTRAAVEVEFPRPSWRGLIEAAVLLRVKHSRSRGFRAHRGAASLKQRDDDRARGRRDAVSAPIVARPH